MTGTRLRIDFQYRCSDCGRAWPLGPELTVCPDCAPAQEKDQPLAGVLDVELDGRVGPAFRIPDLLPIPAEFFPPIPVGQTPLWVPARLRRELGMPHLYLKDDGLNPTGSLKDRASALVSAQAARYGINEIVAASTGNAGSSMAGVGAAAGQKVTLFLPKTAPPAKLVQALQYGARVFRVDGTYDDAYDLSMEYSRQFGGLSRNTAYNPMTIEGKKTAALEIFQQLGRLPDFVFVAAGDGCILSGIYKGFTDMVRLTVTAGIPTVVAVQAEGSNALARAMETGQFDRQPSRTIADSISVDVPRNGRHALRLIQRHQGRIVTVADAAILQAQAHLAGTAGLFTEPAAAAAWAGFLKIKAELPPQAVIVVLLTGHGLKDTASAAKGVNVPEKVIRSLDDLEL